MKNKKKLFKVHYERYRNRMAKGKDPAFLFYSADFMIGTMLLSMEEKGQYITLLAMLHQKGRLSEEHISAILHCEPSENVRDKFKIDENGMWYNERLEFETNKRRKFSESRRNSLDINNNDEVHIYLMFDPKTGNYKIGSSKYPLLRLTDMQKKNSEVSLFWKSGALVLRSEEKKLHDEFKPKKVKNDWFALSEKDITSIIYREIFRTAPVEYSRTGSRTENENENENENKTKKEAAKWNNYPKAENLPDPPEWVIDSFQQQYYATKQKLLQKETIRTYWEGWKFTLTGGKFYSGINDVFTNFINRGLQITFKDEQPGTQSGKQQGLADFKSELGANL